MFAIIKNLKNKIISSIRLKVFFICIPLVLFPIMVFGIISYRMTSASIEENFISHKLSLGKQTIHTFEQNIDDLVLVALNIYSQHDELLEVLNPNSFDTKYVYSLNKISDYCNSLLQTNNSIYGITIANTKGQIKFYMDRQYGHASYKTITDLDWYKEAMSSNNNYTLLEPHTESYTINYSHQQDVISVVIKVISLVSDSTIGLVKLDQKSERLQEVIQDISPKNGEIVAIIGASGNLLYSNTTVNEQALKKALTYEEYTSYNGVYMGKDVLITQVVSDKYGWKLVSILPLKVISQESTFIQNINNSLLIVLVIFMFFVSMFISKIIVSPLKKLSFAFKELRNGNLKARVETKGHDEMAQISKSFNQTTDSIKQLISDKYESNLNRLQAELECMQSQINPHFLYNTLNSIKAIADLNDSYDISTMIKSLSDLLRYNLNNSRNLVTLEEEFKHIQKYLYLQDVRFHGKYTVKWTIEPLSKKCEILRFVIQPIVENAIIHGLKNISSGGLLSISSQIVDQKLIVKIENNGDLMSSNTMRSLNNLLSLEPLSNINKHGEKLGVVNVNSRIKLYYGMEYGISYSLTPQMTIATIMLPIYIDMNLGSAFNNSTMQHTNSLNISNIISEYYKEENNNENTDHR